MFPDACLLIGTSHPARLSPPLMSRFALPHRVVPMGRYVAAYSWLTPVFLFGIKEDIEASYADLDLLITTKNDPEGEGQ